MKKRVSDDELLTLIHLVKRKQRLLPAIKGDDYSTHAPFHTACADLVASLVRDHGARLSHPLGGHRLSLAGVSSTSTGGENGVINNWITAAYRELDRRHAS
ncbi:hypothetical protein [Ancylobacter pratisalsi]|uniref:Uncharacterized protein n=1 Tax=Ancylobacter pratisalsi TaxID=1745854 RepID=A0A6P1YSW5_9HYPH|nr:hypothetical protein [Ancylobacter pratisalsi]QIB34774.1 hypothetical protein G3A50_14445 [Ancylobacter pratisalsi]